MSITVNCTIELTEEELMYILLARAGAAADASVPRAAIVEATPPPKPVDGDYPMTEGIPPSRLPKAPRRAKANGAEAPINSTPLAPPPPPPEALDEPAMRSLLSKVGAVHPLKVKAITDLLEAHGGKRRLSECDPATWPVIAEEAQKVLAEYGA